MNFETTSDIDMICAEVLVVNMVYNYIVDNFLLEKIYIQNICRFRYLFFEFSNGFLRAKRNYIAMTMHIQVCNSYEVLEFDSFIYGLVVPVNCKIYKV